MARQSYLLDKFFRVPFGRWQPPAGMPQQIEAWMVQARTVIDIEQ